ncbi:MAG: DUF935 family protein [Candidatus Hydrogenedentes bacterium]|nr:DUF935 family protein [Candidatus Hydrogenedentota bacterium]
MQYREGESRMARAAARVSGTLSDPRQSTVAFLAAMNRVLRDPSEARRKSREDSRIMRRDPRIEASLKKRKLYTAALKWSIVPEDDKDAGQIEAAETLTDYLESFDLVELIENLLEAIWYGPGPAELMVGFDERGRDYRVTGTRAIHPDSVVFDADGTPLLRVGAGYRGDNAIAGWESRARPLNAVERQIFILHTFNPAAPEFFVPEEAALIYHGSGLREDVWYYWWISNHIHKQWVYFLERYAAGIVMIKHPDTQAGRDAAEAAVRDYKDGNFLLVPIPGDAVDIKAFDIEIKEAPGNVGQLFMDYVDTFTGGYIKQIIEGQVLTSDVGATGLGSGVAQAHESTFQTYIEYDARRLARTLTNQLVARLQSWNNILPDVRFKFEFAIGETTKKETMEAVQAAHAMGVQFKEGEVRDITGLSKPDDGDDVIGGEQMTDQFDFGEGLRSPNGDNGVAAGSNRISGLLDDDSHNGDGR